MSIFVQNFGFTTAPNYFPLSSKVTIKPAEQKPDDPPKPAKSLLMPNSVKKRLETKKVASKVDQKAPLVPVDQSDSDESDEEGGFFSFKSKEDEMEELRKHVAKDVGPVRPSRDMLRVERDKFVHEDQPECSVKYTTTRHPEEVRKF